MLAIRLSSVRAIKNRIESRLSPVAIPTSNAHPGISAALRYFSITPEYSRDKGRDKRIRGKNKGKDPKW